MNNLKNHNCYTLSRNSNRCDVCGARLPRLIDADALKKNFGYTDEWYKSRTVTQIIDDAPTVEERPKGEWIEKVERRGCFAGDKTVYSYTCPFCGAKEFKKYPFCHCGADMRGDV